MYDIDLIETTQADINQLLSLGRKVICHIKVSCEDNVNLYSNILSYLNIAVLKSCTGVEFDSINIYNYQDFTDSQLINYNTWLSYQAHSLDLDIGLRDNTAYIASLVNYFDFLINEDCVNCPALSTFIAANKPVFAVNYVDDLMTYNYTTFCSSVLPSLSYIIKTNAQALPYYSCIAPT